MRKVAAFGTLGVLVILLLAACTAPAETQTASPQENQQITVYKSPT